MTTSQRPKASSAPTPQIDARAFLASTIESERTRFAEQKSLLSFDEYLKVVAEQPSAQIRDAAAFMRDCFTHYGTEAVSRRYGKFTRFRLFDAPFDGGRDRLIGQERVQEQVFGLLSDFVQQGRVTKLILLHGPNGSAKSSFISCIVRALEHYSLQPEGALYTFNWVFPSARLERGSIGFGGVRNLDELPSFAHLAEGDVDARLRTETRDHPLLLLPREARVDLLTSLLGEGVQIPKSLSEGELSPKARLIYDALLRAYQGDLREVFKHVQVERFHISRRYRQAAVTIDPQMRADAGVRQMTADRSLASLPASLQNVTLYEPVGDLVDANRGVLEFNDLLKRPIETFKYLLSTCENGTVRLETMTLHMDTVFIGSCNANHLDGFKQMPDFASFKARIELVTVPYLLDYTLEREIYRDETSDHRVGRPVAPHVSTVAALWAVLTRLERPQPELHPSPLRKVLTDLEPLAKARLYAHAEAPGGLARDVANALVTHCPDLADEPRGDVYEGRSGASPREMKATLLSAARRPGHRCLTPLLLIDELRALCQQRTTYEFLRQKADGEFRRAESYLDVVRDWYLDLVEDELHQAMGLVDTRSTRELFGRYIDQVLHVVRNEKRLNPLTGAYEDPDARLLKDVEQRLGITERESRDFRSGVMQRIAAWRMDNPEDTLNLPELFSDRLSTLNDAFYEEKRAISDRIKRDILTYLVDGEERLEPEALEQVLSTLTILERDLGYARDCAIEVIGALLKERPATT